MTKRKGLAGLSLAALGVAFGDIGTSPLYVIRAVLGVHSGAVDPTPANIYGIISALIWILFVVVTFKYVTLVLRADNDGEGGIIALATLVRERVTGRRKLTSALIFGGMFGAALFFGDAVITPAISVLSAIEGLRVPFPEIPSAVIVPAALTILTLLFVTQRFGTAKVGRVFGPAMLIWFTTLAVIALPHVASNPRILLALSPHYAVLFAIHQPFIAFLALGAVVLAVTGAEALYADIAHFGRRPIQLVWFTVALPALVLNYLGQGANLLSHPQAARDPFFTLVPERFAPLLVVLATVATVVASEAVISGAYSIARQASRLGYLPHLRVRHTSATAAGQIYLPGVNTMLFCVVAVVVFVFGDSERLSAAYGLAVTTDFLLTTAMLLALTRYGWKWRAGATIGLGAILGAIELPLFAANIAKIPTGGWLPLFITGALMLVMTTWRRGEFHIKLIRAQREETLADFLGRYEARPPRRVPGTIIYPHSFQQSVPFALRAQTQLSASLPDHVMLLAIKTAPTPHVDPAERATLRRITSDLPGIIHLTLTYGFIDNRDIPADVSAAAAKFGLASWKLAEATWVLSHIDVRRARGTRRCPRQSEYTATQERPATQKYSATRECSGTRENAPTPIAPMAAWRRKLFAETARHSASPAWRESLPAERTLEISHTVAI